MTTNKYSPLDALIYTEIENNIPVGNKHFDELESILGIQSEAESELNSYLNNTTIKRACCLAQQTGTGWSGYSPDGEYLGIDVKIPTPTNYVYGEDNHSQIQKKFGYIVKKVYVPKSMCSDQGINVMEENQLGKVCDPFYRTYCQNQKYFYNLENNGQYSADEFYIYTNYECPCFADYPSNFFQDPAAENGGGVCFLPNCNEDSGAQNVYFDPSSRPSKKCTADICSQINVTAAATAQEEGTINISNDNVMKCGLTAKTTAESESTSVRNATTKVTNVQTGKLTTNNKAYSDDYNGNVKTLGESSNSTQKTNNTQISSTSSGTGAGDTSDSNNSNKTGNVTNNVKDNTSNTTNNKIDSTNNSTPTDDNGNVVSTSSTSHKKMYIIIGVVVGVLVLIGIIAAVIIMRKKSKK